MSQQEQKDALAAKILKLQGGSERERATAKAVVAALKHIELGTRTLSTRAMIHRKDTVTTARLIINIEQLGGLMVDAAGELLDSALPQE